MSASPAADKTLPAALDAERATLGSVFLDRDAIIPIAPWLESEMFYLERHAWIYEAQLACYGRRIPPDLVNVSDELQRAGRIEAVGGVAYLVECSNATPTAVHVEYYARKVEETAALRKLIQAGGLIAKLGYEGGDVETALESAEAALGQIERKKATVGYQSLGMVVDSVYAAFEAARKAGGTVTGMPTGFRDLDELLGGLQKSDLIILGARPMVGKSSLALSMAYNVALLQRLSVGYQSLEMSREQLAQRLLATHTGVDVQKLRTGDIRESDLQMIMDAMGVLSTLPVHIDDTAGISIRDLRTRALRLQAQHGLDLLIVDYLQLMRGKRNAENRVQEVSDISRGLKEIARELNIPIIALSQLSRAVESRTSHVPMLSDLRESGSLEQDADIVMFIYREELYESDTDKKGVAEIHIAKHRNGPVGIVPLRFFSSTTRFADLERYRQPTGY